MSAKDTPTEAPKTENPETPATPDVRRYEEECMRILGLTAEQIAGCTFLTVPLPITASQKELLLDVASANGTEEKRLSIFEPFVQGLWNEFQRRLPEFEETAKKSRRSRISDLTPEQAQKQLARMQRQIEMLMAAAGQVKPIV